MFQIVCNPSSGSMELYLTEIIRSGSQMFVVCLVGVWQHNLEPVVCMYGPLDRTYTPLVQNSFHRTKSLRTWVTHLIRKFYVFYEIKGLLWYCFHFKKNNYFIQTSQLFSDSVLCISLPWIHIPTLVKSQTQNCQGNALSRSCTNATNTL